MADNFHFPADAQGDDNNEVLFSNNGFDGGYGANDAAAAFNGGWDASSGFLQGASDTFAWHQAAPFQDQQQHQAFQLQNPAAALRPTSGTASPGAFSSIDPSMVAPTHLNRQPFSNPPHHPSRDQGSTVSPTALLTHQSNGSNKGSSTQAAKMPHALTPMPKGVQAGEFSIISKESLNMRFSAREVNQYLSIGNEPIPFTVTATNVPAYVPRCSRAQINRILASNNNLSTKMHKKSSHKAGSIKPISKAARAHSAPSPGTPKVESDSDEYTDASDSESEEEEEASPIGPTRPSGVYEATRYDTIKALWRPRSRPVSAESIREAVKGFWEDLKTIRERWTADQAGADKAEEAKNVKDLPVLQERAKGQRNLLEVAMKAAVQHGHPTVLGNFGRTKALLQILNAFLRDRNKAADYNGSLSVAILDFLVNCGTFDAQEMAAIGMDKVLQRFGTRGDAKTSALVKKVQSNFGTGPSKKATQPLSKASADPAKKDISKKDATGPNGLKRPLPSDGGSTNPSKKVAGETSSIKGLEVKKAGPTPNKAPNTSSQVVKTKVNQVNTKPSGFISSLQSAKKPTAAPAAQKAPTDKAIVDKKVPEKRTQEKKTAAQPSAAPSFSFASILADVSNPQTAKPPTKTKPDTPPQPQETAEEKSKRLRKEARRRHRVHWAASENLEQIRYFEHDPDEEFGHNAAQMRDVKDLKSEMQMFKHMIGTSLDIEDDEDGDAAGGDPFIRQWREPVPVDFATLPDSTKQGNYIPYGGGVIAPQSAEKTANENREATTLLVVYMDDSEIPPSPKEPAVDSNEETSEPKQFGMPSNAFNARCKEVEGAREAMERSKNLSAEISSLLGTIPSFQQPAAPPTAPVPAQQSQDLQSLIGTLTANNSVPAAPPFQNPTASQPPQDLTSILAALSKPAQQSQPPQQNAPALAPIPSGQSAPFNGSDINNILATLNNQSGGPLGQGMGGPQAPMAGQPWMQPQSQSWPGMASMGFQGQPNNVANVGAFDRGPGGGYQQMNNQHDTFQPAGRGYGGYKTQQCKYWPEGKCRKGANCTYKHGDE